MSTRTLLMIVAVVALIAAMVMQLRDLITDAICEATEPEPVNWRDRFGVFGGVTFQPLPPTPAPADLPTAGPGRACDSRPVEATSAVVSPA